MDRDIMKRRMGSISLYREIILMDMIIRNYYRLIMGNADKYLTNLQDLSV